MASFYWPLNKRFDVLVTTDKNLAYQQNLRNRKIAIVVLALISLDGISLWRLLSRNMLRLHSPSRYAEYCKQTL